MNSKRASPGPMGAPRVQGLLWGLLCVAVGACSDGRTSSQPPCALSLQPVGSTPGGGEEPSKLLLRMGAELTPPCQELLHKGSDPIEVSLEAQSRGETPGTDIILLSVETPALPARSHSFVSQKTPLHLGSGKLLTQFTSTFGDSVWHPPWRDGAPSLQVTISVPANLPDSSVPNVVVTIAKKG